MNKTLNLETATNKQITEHARQIAFSINANLTWCNATAICPACDSGKAYAFCNCPQANEEIANLLFEIAKDYSNASGQKLAKAAARLMPSA